MDGVNERVRMTRLTSVSGSFAARVIQARLEDEGLTVALRGCIDGPYAFTVGAMGRVDVFVAEGDLEDAQLIMLASEVDSALELPPQRERPRRSAPWGDRAFWILLVAIVMLGVVPIARMALGS
ncbi:MAG TPA: hypothetical protein VHL53_23535 [Acidimicrobiia bacterium]|nr:hypothetical protein [Acidimicrobiia bacterium]